MKTVIIIPDGCADEPQESLGGCTPLQAAKLPAMDAVASAGVVGRACHVPPRLAPGSAVANMSLLGYDPTTHFSGRAPIEAVAQGIALGENDWAIRCNLVTIEEQQMRDFTAGHIGTDEATILLKAVQEEIHRDELEFVPGVSYRNLLLWRGALRPAPFTTDTRATPPHDLTDRTVANDFPRGPGSDVLCEFMQQSTAIFAEHPINAARIAAGKLPATHIWLWGLGRRPSLKPFAEVYGQQGVMITAVDLLRGLATLIGWDCIEVAGATGYLDTDYTAKGRAAIEAIEKYDIICVHIEAPDEASHEGRTDAKIEALEQIDQYIVAPVHAALKAQGDYRLLITPDHPTFLRTKTHSHGDVPLALCGKGIAADASQSYDEVVAASSDLAFPDGWRMMEKLSKGVF